MTILIEQSQTEVEYNDKKVLSDPSELVLDGGFVMPDANAFGQTFRDYEAESERRATVKEFYRINHIHQSVEFVKRMREEYGKLNRVEMSIWECCELLNEFVDESDPDLDEPQIEHLLQTAEAIRRDYPNEDWLHLTGLIHDLGKVLLHQSFGELPQWAVVGDTFPVGCAFDESNVHHKFFKGNPDYHNPKYNTKYGIYSEGCGLDNVLMSWGHDDYMYLVAKESKTTLPSAGLFIIRYHSFYPLHKFGAYQHLMNDEDKENLKWLHIFNKYDLYSKSKVRIDVEKVKPYYLSLIEKVVAFATFFSHQAAVAAMSELNGIIFDPETGGTLHVELARSNSRRRPRGDEVYSVIDKRVKIANSDQDTGSNDGDGGSDEPSDTENDSSNKKGALAAVKSSRAGRKPDSTEAALNGQSEKRSSDEIPPCSTLFIANLGPTCTEEEVKQVLSECHGFVMLKMRGKGGMPVVFADFMDVEASTAAMEKLQGSMLPSSDRGGMHLEYARSKMKKN